MIIVQRLTPYWSTLLLIVMVLSGVYRPALWPYVVAAAVILPVSVLLIIRQPHWRWEYVGLSIPMIMLLISAYTLTLIQESPWIIGLILLVTTVCFWLFEKNLTVFVLQPAKYIPYSLEHISTYINLVASFYVYVSIFIFSILRLTRLRYLIVAALLATALLVWQNFWIEKLDQARARWYVLIISIIMVEGVWVLHFWPVSFFVTGMMLTLGLYILLHVAEQVLQHTLTRRLVWRYVMTSSLAAVILLVTARWL